MISSTMREHVILPSPIGPLTLVAEAGQLTGLYMDAQQHRPGDDTIGTPGDPGTEPFAAAVRQLAAYFAGQLTEFDLPLAPAGTEFQRRVWAALQTIPYGQTWSYGQLADKLGNASASRAVGLANGRNPIALVIPCHRVIGSDGSLTGYGGGLDRKRFLLDLEASAAGESAGRLTIPQVAPVSSHGIARDELPAARIRSTKDE
jgi:methylated-DNA-[protein]-cysteine S-methyltransferase